MTAIRIEGIAKSYGDTVAVKRVDLSIPAGSLFFLLGPSGCGKTTLLRMLAGFTEPSAGRIWFGERDVASVPANERNTGMVFQNYALWPHLSVAQNVAFGLEVRKLPRARVEEKVRRALELVRMSGYDARKPAELSGGQQQRVALARAVVIEPSVLLLDEPLSNLDAKLRIEMRSEIRRIVDTLRITTVYVTHDREEALSLADGMALLRAGELVQQGTPRAMYRRPESRFVADFLGDTNFIPAIAVRSDGNEALFKTAAGNLLSRAAPFPRASELALSIRPEALRMSRGGVADAVNRIGGVIRATRYFGGTAQHEIALDGGDPSLRVRVAELNPADPPAEGERVTLTVDPSDVVPLAT